MNAGSESADEKSMAVTEEGETYSEWLELRYLGESISYLIVRGGTIWRESSKADLLQNVVLKVHVFATFVAKMP